MHPRSAKAQRLKNSGGMYDSDEPCRYYGGHLETQGWGLDKILRGVTESQIPSKKNQDEKTPFVNGSTVAHRTRVQNFRNYFLCNENFRNYFL